MRKINLLRWKIYDPINSRPGHQIVDFVIQKIQSCEARPGERLPSQLAFSSLNHINSNTVKRAYANLLATGWLTTLPGSGTFVKRSGAENEDAFTSTGFVNEMPIVIERGPKVSEPSEMPVQNFTTVGLNTLNPYNYPERAMLKYRRMHRKRYENISQIDQITDFYGVAYKEAVRSYYNDCRDFKFNQECMDIVPGRKESLVRVIQTILNPGDCLVNTSSQDLVLGNVLYAAEVRSQFLSTMDNDFVEKLEDLVKVSEIKLLYLRPQCGYPECNVLDAEKCARVLELAKKYKFYILEEDDYHEFWYRQTPYKPLACYDHEGYVIYIGALSQLSVYMRNTRVIGATKDFIDAMNAVPPKPCEFHDVLEENAIIEMIKSGDLWRYASEIRKIKEKDRDDLFWVLRNYLEDFMEIQAPDSGLAFWIRFPDFSTLRESMNFLEKQEINVPYNPGMSFNDPNACNMYLGFGTYNQEEAEVAAKLLKERFENVLRNGFLGWLMMSVCC
nr:GntR family transcriptional regulator [Pedobacter panaciterrae]